MPIYVHKKAIIMPEENTTENKAPIAPDLEDGELSEDDLEAAAGGVMGSQQVQEVSKIANNTSVGSRPIFTEPLEGP